MKKYHLFFTCQSPAAPSKACWQKSFVLFAALLAFSFTAFAQANFWTIFGNPSITASTGCNTGNLLSCNTTPGTVALSNISPLNDPYHCTTCYLTDLFKNSLYDKSGELLFSVNGDGIYCSDGTFLYDFNQYLPSNVVGTGCGGTAYTYIGTAISEIAIFPAPGKCNSYYAVFWCGFSGSTTTGSSLPFSLRCIEIDINTAVFGNAPAFFHPYLLPSSLLVYF